MKKILQQLLLGLLTLIILGTFAYLLITDHHDPTMDWMTVSKKGNSIVTHKTTEEEKIKANLPITKHIIQKANLKNQLIKKG